MPCARVAVGAAGRRPCCRPGAACRACRRGTAATLGLWQVPQVSGMFARLVRLSGIASWRGCRACRGSSCTSGAEPCAAPLQRLAVDAVVELAADVAAGQLALRDDRRRCRGTSSTWPRGWRGWSRDAGSFDAQDVVRAVAVGAGGGDASLPPLRALPCTVPAYSRDRLLVAARAVDRLQLVGVRQLVRRHVGVAVGALELHLAVHRCLERSRRRRRSDLPAAFLASLSAWHIEAGVVAGRRRGQRAGAATAKAQAITRTRTDRREQRSTWRPLRRHESRWRRPGAHRMPGDPLPRVPHSPRTVTQVNLTQRPGGLGWTNAENPTGMGTNAAERGFRRPLGLAGRGHDDAVTATTPSPAAHPSTDSKALLASAAKRRASGSSRRPRQLPRAGRRTTRSSFRWRD